MNHVTRDGKNIAQLSSRQRRRAGEAKPVFRLSDKRKTSAAANKSPARGVGLEAHAWPTTVNGEWPTLRASEIMSAPVTCISQNASLRIAMTRFAEHDLYYLPVIDEGAHVVGLLSRAHVFHVLHDDSLEGEGELTRHRLYNPVRCLMTKNRFECVASDACLGDFAGKLIQSEIRLLIVVDENGAPVGTVTRTDLLRATFVVDGDSQRHWA